MKTKVEHIWCKSNDRWIYLEYNNNEKLIGMNFMQGDDYEYFKKLWCKSDAGLIEFYNYMIFTFPHSHNIENKLSFINKCMWAFHTAISQREENPLY